MDLFAIFVCSGYWLFCCCLDVVMYWLWFVCWLLLLFICLCGCGVGVVFSGGEAGFSDEAYQYVVGWR